MKTFKSIFGLAGVIGPVIYCGGLLYYFLDLSGSVQEADAIGLGPTVLGLGAVGVLFSIPLIMKTIRLLTKPRTPGSGGGAGPSSDDDDNGFDADAAIARYMAQRSLEAAAPAAAPAPARPSGHRTGGQTGRPGFGRRTR